ncbi:MAG: AAA family ATPase [Nanoarchaeota archaeon]
MVERDESQIETQEDNVVYSYTAETNQLEAENKLLRETISQLQNELMRIQQPSLMICEVMEVQNENKNAIIKVPNGNQFYVNVSSSCKKLQAGDTVLCEQKNLTVIRRMDVSKKFDVEKFVILEKPQTKWKDVGGLDRQIEEVKEVIELPLKKPALFSKIGIDPPKGILLYGPPGTGKTIMAKAVAASTQSTFIEIVASELVQKFIGEGAKLIKEIFELARRKAPSIIFIDELDALCANRIELGTSGEREVQRTFMQFLAEIDGFKPLGNIKIIGCTNRKDILDPAIVRPGRLDRLIEVPIPSQEGIEQIFKIHTRKMSLGKNVDVAEIAKNLDGFSGAEIKAVCTEAGYFAIRDNKGTVSKKNFVSAIQKVRQEEELEGDDYMRMFG